MALDDISRNVKFTGDGQTTEFPFSFVVFDPADIAVYTLDETGYSSEEVSTDAYTVQVNEGAGGTVTFATAPADGFVFSIVSEIPYDQTMNLTPYDGMNPEVLNQNADKTVAQIQQLKAIADRALKAPEASDKTPDELMGELLAAQETAQASASAAAASAEAAEDSKEEAAEILEEVKDASDNADKILPYADDLNTVAKNIESVKTTGRNITNVNIVAGDLDTTTQSVSVDYGDYDDNTGSGTIEVPTGGNIVTVATYINAVNAVAQNMSSILAIEDKIDGLDATIAEMDEAVAAAETAAGNASSSATAAASSATSALTQKNLAKDWAVKMDGKIVEAGAEVDYSAKYYASMAADCLTGAQTAKTQAETAADDAQTAQSAAETAASTATTKASEAAQSATDAGNAKAAALTAQTAAETAQAAAEAAQEAAEQAAASVGDPLGKEEAASTYATKTELSTGLSGKANTSHTHEISAVNGLQAALDGKQAAGSYAAAVHTHTSSDVTDLGALATKDSVGASDLAQTIDLGDYDA